MDEKPFESLLIRADRAVAFQHFIEHADLLKRRNFSKVAVQMRVVLREMAVACAEGVSASQFERTGAGAC